MRFSTRVAGFLMVCLIFCFSLLKAQDLYPVSIDEKVVHASLIVEGKVIGKKSYWNSAHTMIYTSNEIEVYKVFKGNLQQTRINVVTVGGAVGDHCILTSNLLTLDIEDVGVFFCEENPRLKTLGPVNGLFDVYSSRQGFVRYNLDNKSANTPFANYDDIEKTLYRELQIKTGRKIEIKNRSFSITPPTPTIQSNNSILAPVITSFSPATVNAGTLLDPANNELTINGSGFGPASGSAAVLFSHADFSPGTQFAVIPYNNELIKSWSDTKIVVRTPTAAGTGIFKVRDNAGTIVNSPSNLDVRYSVLTADFMGQSGIGIKQFNLGNMNGSGGYSLKYSTNTANSGVNINTSPAKETFKRALNTWKETVGLNFVEAGTSNLQVVDVNDNENLIMYDNGGTTIGPLGAGVLATCFSGITICGGDPVNNQARKSGFDIVIRNTGYSTGSTPFTLGPCPPFSEPSSVVDLESVLLHELGHALNLGHIVDALQGSGAGTATPAKVMHFSVSFNQRRISLDYSAKVGGTFCVTQHAYTYGTCVVGAAEMSPLATILEAKDECPATFPVSTTPMFTTVNFDLSHATSNKFVDPAFNQMTVDGTGANITNTAYYVFRTGSSGGDLSLEILNYSTVPVEVKDCPIGGTGIQVTGVKLAVYAVPACPTGGAYPTPIAYRTFSASGIVPAISGLTGNSTYLLVVDGIQNTKAVFDMVFSGSALPVLSANLTGEVVGSSNHLSWTTDPDFGATEMILERSVDGETFNDLIQVPDGQLIDGEYLDESPLPGDNFYRLWVKNTNGVIQYSKIVKLNSNEGFSLSLYPNPASQELNIKIISEEPGKYGISIFNVYGQKVYRKDVNVTSRIHVETVEVTGFKVGMYLVAVYNKDNKRITAGTIKFR